MERGEVEWSCATHISPYNDVLYIEKGISDLKPALNTDSKSDITLKNPGQMVAEPNKARRCGFLRVWNSTAADFSEHWLCPFTILEFQSTRVPRRSFASPRETHGNLFQVAITVPSGQSNWRRLFGLVKTAVTKYSNTCLSDHGVF
jgi:hypothetical protein